MNQDRITKWRQAHPEIAIDHEVLASLDHSCPSLSVTDFCLFLESSGVSQDVISYIRDLGIECRWAYDNWTKAQRDNDPGKLMLDQVNNCDGPEYVFTSKFLRDYAKANNIHIPSPSDETTRQEWLGKVADGPMTTGPRRDLDNLNATP